MPFIKVVDGWEEDDAKFCWTDDKKYIFFLHRDGHFCTIRQHDQGVARYPASYQDDGGQRRGS